MRRRRPGGGAKWRWRIPQQRRRALWTGAASGAVDDWRCAVSPVMSSGGGLCAAPPTSVSGQRRRPDTPGQDGATATALSLTSAASSSLPPSRRLSASSPQLHPPSTLPSASTSTLTFTPASPSHRVASTSRGRETTVPLSPAPPPGPPLPSPLPSLNSLSLYSLRLTPAHHQQPHSSATYPFPVTTAALPRLSS